KYTIQSNFKEITANLFPQRPPFAYLCAASRPGVTCRRKAAERPTTRRDPYDKGCGTTNSNNDK
ncbi:MAG: hypothetical protein K2H69_02365, partial [Alistipes sp.]|nr:hypothetical protein [Alistipes sp.]